MILLFCVVIISLRITYIFKRKVKVAIYNEIFYLIFLVYILFLFHIVTFQDVGWSTSNFTPFKEIFRYDFGSNAFYKNVVGNMIMFMPYGLFVSYFIQLKKPYIIFILSFIVSITIETTQLVIGRVFDIDDIFLNILGGLFGFLIYHFLEKLINKLPSFLKKDWIYNIITILVICAGVVFFIVL
ncbi:MAG: VanZ family protein [Bacilli bacterium]|nr:VanZ family protein [Bacilli bacterium]